MKPFVFSADAHVVEPGDLFQKLLPERLKAQAIVVEKQGEYMITRSGAQVMYRHRILTDQDFGRLKRLGARDLQGRFKDMELDGIDAELVFPSMALWTFTIKDAELEAAHARIYNDWCYDFFGEHLDKFVPANVLPVRDFAQTLAELRYIAARGLKTAMLPSVTQPGIPAYNSDAWDPVFHLAGELGIVFALHTGTGLEDVVQERGPGGAVINYTRQMLDAMQATMYLVAGGVLDRNPKSKVAFVECGASWLAGVAERMDESYAAFALYTRPKLSRRPSQIIRDQVKATFQNERECILARQITGHEAILWGADYPHHEGTFPRSREIIQALFSGIEITEDEKADIVGRTAARLFGLRRPEFSGSPATA
jgi:predicted TIM-barrel fold metal-dependent hydrolase